MFENYSVGSQIFILLVLIFLGLAMVGPLLYILFTGLLGEVSLTSPLQDGEPIHAYAMVFFGLSGIYFTAFYGFLKLTRQRARNLIRLSPFQFTHLLLTLVTLTIAWFGAEGLYHVNAFLIDRIPNSNLTAMEEELSRSYEVLFRSEDGIQTLWALFVFALLPALVEELVFRGVLMHQLKEVSNGNSHFAVLVSALLFAAFHQQPWNVLPMTGLAVAFGYVYHYTGDIRYSMLMHFLYNGVQILMFSS